METSDNLCDVFRHLSPVKLGSVRMSPSQTYPAVSLEFGAKGDGYGTGARLIAPRATFTYLRRCFSNGGREDRYLSIHVKEGERAYA